MTEPHIRYARSGGSAIAYQVSGEGSLPLVIVNGPASHLELMWDEPATQASFERIGGFARAVMFDRRGTGLSDPVVTPPTLEQQMDDLEAVLDDIGLDRVALFGASDLGLCAMYAATHPGRVSALVLSGVAPKGGVMMTPQTRALFLDAIENGWGDGTLLQLFAPSRVDDREFVRWWGRMQRSALSPGMARQLLDMIAETDLRAVLPTINVPTLVTHMSGDRLVPVELGRHVAELIPGARFIEYPGDDAYAWCNFPGLDDIEEFLTGRRSARALDRALATVMFTDIVGSTGHAARLGDSRWRALLDHHNDLVRERLSRWRGREVKTLGDSFMATFDGPARAVRCAEEIVEAVREADLEVRVGLHTGECELLAGDVAGIAVHIASRVTESAGPSEVLVSSTVKDLVAGSGLAFSDRGEHTLRGVPDSWRLYALAQATSD